jgi:hypothetical protein
MTDQEFIQWCMENGVEIPPGTYYLTDTVRLT